MDPITSVLHLYRYRMERLLSLDMAHLYYAWTPRS
jgi:hypothetical protein